MEFISLTITGFHCVVWYTIVAVVMFEGEQVLNKKYEKIHEV